MMHLAELETAVRYHMPLLVTVLNDEALGSEYRQDERRTTVRPTWRTIRRRISARRGGSLVRRPRRPG